MRDPTSREAPFPAAARSITSAVPAAVSSTITSAVTLAVLGVVSAAIVAAPFCTGPAAAASEVTSVDGNRITVTLEAETYEVIETPSGHRLKMDGFGALRIPGAPLLPMKKVLVALPPGARAVSVEVLSARTSEFPRTLRIEPAARLAFLPDMPDWDAAMQRMEEEWGIEYDAVYSSDAPFPAEAAWLAGRGTLRKISYASIAFCPFTYFAESGRLEYHREIEIAIDYVSPSPDGPEARLLDQLMQDQLADARASDLFFNYAELASSYSPQDAPQPLVDEAVDLLIVTVDNLQAAIAASDFPAWKSAQGFSLRTVLTTDSEVTAQPGVDLAEQIRNCLRFNYASWGVQYVLFVGDYATVPMRICYPDPEFHVYDPSDPGLVAPGTPTDYYYADLSYPDAVSWDSDGDGYHGEYGEDDPDFLAEVAVGRIPVNDPARITYALDKLVAFEQDGGAWKNNVLHAGSILFFENQNHDNVPFIDGSTLLNGIETDLMGGYDITHFTERSGIVTSSFDWPPISEVSFTNTWRGDAHAIVNWSGHGWSDGAYRTIWSWDDGDGIPESGELQSHRFIGTTSNLDDDHPSIVFAVSCNVGYPDPNPYGNLGIDLLTVPGWGSSAGIVSSARPAAISRDWVNDPGGTEQICYDFNRHLIVEAKKVGDALYDGKFDATTVYGWDRVYEYMNLYNFNLFGDPSLEVNSTTTSVADAQVGEGPTLALRAMSPNPFAASTSLRVAVSDAGAVRATVYDVGGRHVATLSDGGRAAGEFAVTWDGTTDAGQRLGSGLYFIVVEAGSQRISRKLVLLR